MMARVMKLGDISHIGGPSYMCQHVPMVYSGIQVQPAR